MKIKNIITVCLVSCSLIAPFTSCSEDNEPFYSANDDDSPRILNTDFPKENPNNADSPILFSIKRNQNLKFELLVTPVGKTTVTWFIDDKQVAEGEVIDIPVETGDYVLRIVATTNKGKETSRTCKLSVSALNGDPVPGKAAVDRLAAPGANMKLHGTNMSDVSKIVIGDKEVSATYNAADDCVDYTAPADLAEGVYRISVIDSKGASYGGGLIQVVTTACLFNSSIPGVSKGTQQLDGRNLSQVEKITINGVDCPITSKSESAIIIETPELEVGDFELKGTTTGGKALKMFEDNTLVEVGKYIISSETILWMGDHAVSWALADGNPNKEWKFLSQEDFAKFAVGHTLYISLKFDATATYHQYQIDNYGWNSLPGQTKTDISGDTVVEMPITQELKNAVAADGFAIHGHGFSVIRVSYK